MRPGSLGGRRTVAVKPVKTRETFDHLARLFACAIQEPNEKGVRRCAGLRLPVLVSRSRLSASYASHGRTLPYRGETAEPHPHARCLAEVRRARRTGDRLSLVLRRCRQRGRRGDVRADGAGARRSGCHRGVAAFGNANCLQSPSPHSHRVVHLELMRVRPRLDLLRFFLLASDPYIEQIAREHPAFQQILVVCL